MKCLVWGEVYEAAECPRCRFPDIQIMGDQKTALASLMPTIQAYRKNFLGNVKVELVAYRWKAQDGQVVPDCEEHMLLGTAGDLQKGEIWLANKFARIADVETISVTVCITVAGTSRKVQVPVPNLHQPELQQLGACLDDDLNLQLLLRNDTQLPTRSATVPLFPA